MNAKQVIYKLVILKEKLTNAPLCKISEFATLAWASYFLRSARNYNETEVWYVRFFSN